MNEFSFYAGAPNVFWVYRTVVGAKSDKNYKIEW